MLKQAYEFLSQLFTISQRLNQHDEEMREFWRDLRTTSAVSTRLYYDQANIRDEFQRLAERASGELKYQAEREAEARKLFQAQVEIQLLRAAHSLPPAEPAALPPQPTEPLQTQMDALATALQQAQEQRLLDQTEIAQLKAQMTALSANQPKQES